jgi:nucleotide-binding universal stress UspA family protein
MSAFERIVVGVDGLEGGRDALALAALLQATGGGELVAVYAYSYDRTVSLDEAEHVEAGLLEQLRERLGRELEHAGVHARLTVVCGTSPARALQATAERERACVLVVGSTHRARGGRVLAGDITTATMRGAKCPVAVAPRGFAHVRARFRRIGAGVDGSPESRAALRLAERLARAAGAPVRALVAITPTDGAGSADSSCATLRRAAQLLDTAGAKLGSGVTGEIVPGQPGPALAKRSRELDLLVVGSRGHGPVRRALLGSTSAHLVQAAACPLVVVPRHAASQPARTRALPADAVAR